MSHFGAERLLHDLVCLRRDFPVELTQYLAIKIVTYDVIFAWADLYA
jgi:hypothetical protein